MQTKPPDYAKSDGDAELADIKLRSRASRACDISQLGKKRKIKCIPREETPPSDSSQAICQHCHDFGLSCTYEVQFKKRGPPKHKDDYTRRLEERCAALEERLAQVAPAADGELSPLQSNTTLMSRGQELEPASEEEIASPVDGRSIFHSVWRNPDTSPMRSRATTPIADSDIVVDVKKYFGRSSGFSLVQAVSDVRRNTTSQSAPLLQTSETDGLPGHVSTAMQLILAANAVDPANLPAVPLDLRDELIDLYFANLNCYIPLLHRPAFERSLNDPQIMRTPAFLSVLYSVMALGCRFSTDSRIYTDFGFPKGQSTMRSDFKDIPKHAAGYSFASVSIHLASPFLLGASLHDLQASVLIVSYLSAAASLTSAWIVLGFYMRRMIDVGAHRHRNQIFNGSVLVDEQRKRAFWSLYILDVVLSAGMGRPVSIAEEQIDLTYPFEVTDEQLDRLEAQKLAFPRRRPKPSPTARPTFVKGFNVMIQIAQITARALTELYKVPLHRWKNATAAERVQADERTVAEIDHLLNGWLNRLPAYLQWNSKDLHSPYLTQRGLCLSMYYACQLFVHRDFLSPDHKVSYPSQNIVLNCARSICNILWSLTREKVIARLIPHAPIHVVSAVMPLLMNVYGANKIPELDSDVTCQDVKKGIKVLKVLADHCFTSANCQPGVTKLADIDSLRNKRSIVRSDTSRGELPILGDRNALDAEYQPAFCQCPSAPGIPGSGRGSKRLASTNDRDRDNTFKRIRANHVVQSNADWADLFDFHLPYYTQDLGRSNSVDFDTLLMSSSTSAATTSLDYASNLFSNDPISFNDALAGLNYETSPPQIGERENAVFLSNSPFADFFDPNAFGSSLIDFSQSRGS